MLAFFASETHNYNIFGRGPWPCLNKVAEYYRMNVVNNLKITEDYKTRLPVRTFSCDCGFVYSRKGPDKVSGDRYRVGRIKEFSAVWENKLKVYLNENKHDLRELASKKKLFDLLNTST
ncbi:TnsD family Tn7-like transposition protein [Clostridium estertheticum]|uniref:TnsD family Tn7-like transposition protein n=1 Tax=Clostridium estertheticum TaxID=238834 RepID=UPI0021F47E7B|nr:TnsD family Tn7-like transposition protein [Clostridium estertheticum]